MSNQQLDQERITASIQSLPADAETQVVLVTGKPESFVPFRLNPTTSLAGEFRIAALDFANSIASRALVPYSPGRKPDEYEIATIQLGAVGGLDSILRTAQQPTDLELFDPDSREARSLRFYVVAVRRTPQRWVHFMRAMSARSRLKRSGKIAAVFGDAVFTSLEADPLLFDRRFDAVISDGVVLVADQRNFERTLGFLEAAKQASITTLTQVTTGLRIQNKDEFFMAASEDINMIAKLRGITEKIERDSKYQSRMTMARITQFATEHPEYEIDLEGSPGKEELVFHGDPQRRWRILKLLDDDYLHSQLTEHDYEANSKSLMG